MPSFNSLKTMQKMSEREVKEMQRKIDEGILVAQQRLVARARRDDATLIIARDGVVVEVPAKDLQPTHLQ
jgi:hypothetical protein